MSYTKPTDRNKSWYKKTLGKKPYQVGKFEPSKSFLIVCEGENTERLYFEMFPVVTASIKCIGLGASRMALVKMAQELSKQTENKGKEIWCVFDYDYNANVISIAEDFNHAVTYAQKIGLKSAYSNDSFELWFLLHYQFLDAKLSRFQYYTRLSELWGVNYEREGKRYDFCKQLFSRLEKDPKANLSQAIENARKLFEKQSDLLPADQNPCTKVYELVEELLKYSRK